MNHSVKKRSVSSLKKNVDDVVDNVVHDYAKEKRSGRYRYRVRRRSRSVRRRSRSARRRSRSARRRSRSARRR
jgi:hypothetical protein